jgi:hypothetical protein
MSRRATPLLVEDILQHRCRDCLGDHPEGFAKPQVEAFAHPRVTDRAAHFHVSGIPETWKFGLNRIRETSDCVS